MNTPVIAAIALIALASGLGARHLVLCRFGASAPPREYSRAQGRPQPGKKTSLTAALRRAGEMAQPPEEEESKTRRELMRAGLRIDPLTWRGIQASALLAAFALGALALLFAQPDFPFVLAVAGLVPLLGLGAPKLYLASRARERRNKLRAALPSTLELLNTAMRAGYSLERGIKLVGTATTGPLAQEFRRVDQEVNLLSMPLDKALLRMKDRCDTPCISSFVNAMVQAHQQGTSMSRALNAQARAARAQHFSDTLVLINQLPNKMVPVIFLFFFPIIIVLAVAPVIYNTVALIGGMS